MRLPLVIAIPVLAIIGIVLFILTQNMRLEMTLVDLWTIAHGILFAGGILSYIFAYKRDKDEEDDGGNVQEVDSKTLAAVETA